MGSDFLQNEEVFTGLIEREKKVNLYTACCQRTGGAKHFYVSCNGKWQATRWPAAISRNSGATELHLACA